MSELFPQGFMDMLAIMMRQMRRFRGRRAEEGRARLRVQASSGSFIGHRAYSAGEDLRLVDWNAYARSGEVHIKVLEEDQRQTMTILADTSASMLAGTPSRAIGGRQFAAVLGALALARLDGLRLVCSPEEVYWYQGAGELTRMLRDLENLSVHSCEPMEMVRPLLARGWQGSLCWLSDFAVPEDYQRALRLLRSHDRRCTAILPSTPDDQLPPLSGFLRIEDPESGDIETVLVDQALRSAMEAELRILTQQQQSMCRELGVPLRRFTIPEAGDHRLSSWFPGPWIYRI